MKDSVYADMEKSEKQVADYLRELDLWWVYEFPVFVYDEKTRPRVWTPDFYIPKLGMHVEVCGKEREDYEYRDRIYKKNGYHVIFVHLYKERKEGRSSNPTPACYSTYLSWKARTRPRTFLILRKSYD